METKKYKEEEKNKEEILNRKKGKGRRIEKLIFSIITLLGFVKPYIKFEENYIDNFFESEIERNNKNNEIRIQMDEFFDLKRCTYPKFSFFDIKNISSAKLENSKNNQNWKKRDITTLIFSTMLSNFSNISKILKTENSLNLTIVGFGYLKNNTNLILENYDISQKKSSLSIKLGFYNISEIYHIDHLENTNKQKVIIFLKKVVFSNFESSGYMIVDLVKKKKVKEEWTKYKEELYNNGKAIYTDVLKQPNDKNLTIFIEYYRDPEVIYYPLTCKIRLRIFDEDLNNYTQMIETDINGRYKNETVGLLNLIQIREKIFIIQYSTSRRSIIINELKIEYNEEFDTFEARIRELGLEDHFCMKCRVLFRENKEYKNSYEITEDFDKKKVSRIGDFYIYNYSDDDLDIYNIWNYDEDKYALTTSGIVYSMRFITSARYRRHSNEIRVGIFEAKVSSVRKMTFFEVFNGFAILKEKILNIGTYENGRKYSERLSVFSLDLKSGSYEKNYIYKDNLFFSQGDEIQGYKNFMCGTMGFRLACYLLEPSHIAMELAEENFEKRNNFLINELKVVELGIDHFTISNPRLVVSEKLRINFFRNRALSLKINNNKTVEDVQIINNSQTSIMLENKLKIKGNMAEIFIEKKDDNVKFEILKGSEIKTEMPECQNSKICRYFDTGIFEIKSSILSKNKPVMSFMTDCMVMAVSYQHVECQNTAKFGLKNGKISDYEIGEITKISLYGSIWGYLVDVRDLVRNKIFLFYYGSDLGDLKIIYKSEIQVEKTEEMIFSKFVLFKDIRLYFACFKAGCKIYFIRVNIGSLSSKLIANLDFSTYSYFLDYELLKMEYVEEEQEFYLMLEKKESIFGEIGNIFGGGDKGEKEKIIIPLSFKAETGIFSIFSKVNLEEISVEKVQLEIPEGYEKKYIDIVATKKNLLLFSTKNKDKFLISVLEYKNKERKNLSILSGEISRKKLTKHGNWVDLHLEDFNFKKIEKVDYDIRMDYVRIISNLKYEEISKFDIQKDYRVELRFTALKISEGAFPGNRRVNIVDIVRYDEYFSYEIPKENLKNLPILNMLRFEVPSNLGPREYYGGSSTDYELYFRFSEKSKNIQRNSKVLKNEEKIGSRAFCRIFPGSPILIFNGTIIDEGNLSTDIDLKIDVYSPEFKDPKTGEITFEKSSRELKVKFSFYNTQNRAEFVDKKFKLTESNSKNVLKLENFVDIKGNFMLPKFRYVGPEPWKHVNKKEFPKISSKIKEKNSYFSVYYATRHRRATLLLININAFKNQNQKNIIIYFNANPTFASPLIIFNDTLPSESKKIFYSEEDNKVYYTKVYCNFYQSMLRKNRGSFVGLESTMLEIRVNTLDLKTALWSGYVNSTIEWKNSITDYNFYEKNGDFYLFVLGYVGQKLTFFKSERNLSSWKYDEKKSVPLSDNFMERKCFFRSNDDFMMITFDNEKKELEIVFMNFAEEKMEKKNLNFSNHVSVVIDISCVELEEVEYSSVEKYGESKTEIENFLTKSSLKKSTPFARIFLYTGIGKSLLITLTKTPENRLIISEKIIFDVGLQVFPRRTPKIHLSEEYIIREFNDYSAHFSEYTARYFYTGIKAWNLASKSPSDVSIQLSYLGFKDFVPSLTKNKGVIETFGITEYESEWAFNYIIDWSKEYIIDFSKSYSYLKSNIESITLDLLFLEHDDVFYPDKLKKKYERDYYKKDLEGYKRRRRMLAEEGRALDVEDEVKVVRKFENTKFASIELNELVRFEEWYETNTGIGLIFSVLISVCCAFGRCWRKRNLKRYEAVGKVEGGGSGQIELTSGSVEGDKQDGSFD